MDPDTADTERCGNEPPPCAPGTPTCASDGTCNGKDEQTRYYPTSRKGCPETD